MLKPGLYLLEFLGDHKWAHPFFRYIKETWQIDASAQVKKEGDVDKIFFSFRTDSLFDPLKWERLPNRFKAALSFTDHADYDSTDRLEGIFFGKGGLCEHNIRITKSIFVNSKKADNSLASERFYKLIKRLAEHGNEIAAHSTRFLPAKRDAVESDLPTLSPFSPTTWIDHSYANPVSICVNGAQEGTSGYILDLLAQFGYQQIWAYVDISSDPPTGNLNMLNPEGTRPFDYFKRAMAEVVKRKFWLARLYFQQCVRWAIGYNFLFSVSRVVRLTFKIRSLWQLRIYLQSLGILVGFCLNPLKLVRVIKGFFRQNPIAEAGTVFYTHSRVAIDATEPFTLFTSILINNYSDAFSPSNVDKLIKERGIHIAHTYLACTRSNYRDKAWELRKGQFCISKGFESNCRYMAKKMQEGALWIVPISELANFYRSLKRLRIINLSDEEVKVINGGETIKGLTLTKNVQRRIKKVMLNTKELNYIVEDDTLYLVLDLERGEHSIKIEYLEG